MNGLAFEPSEQDQIAASVGFLYGNLMDVPTPTTVFRFLHVDNLHIYLERASMHAPNFWPDDGLVWKTNHDEQVQNKRRREDVPCGPKGTVHDYVPFYFGPLSPMMFKLKTGQVPGYDEGQEPLIYLVSTCQAVAGAGIPFAFSDGHGIAIFTRWFDNLDELDNVDWDMVGQRYWADNINDMDRQRRKQAEFLVHRVCPWELVDEVVVLNQTMKTKIETLLAEYPENLQRVVKVKPEWYYH